MMDIFSICLDIFWMVLTLCFSVVAITTAIDETLNVLKRGKDKRKWK